MVIPSIKPSTAILAIVACLVALGGYLGWLWQPDRQLRMHQENLILAAERRSARKVGSFLSAKYSDPWNKSGDEAIERLGMILRSYFVLSIRETQLEMRRSGDTGTVVSHLSLEGKGTAVGEFATRRVNDLAEPFTFHWRRESWKPWDWKLTRVENPSLVLSGGGMW